MPQVQLTGKSAARKQIDEHNRAGPWNRRVTYTQPAGTAYCVVATLLNAAVQIPEDPDDLGHLGNIRTQMLNLAQVDAVPLDVFAGQTPAVIDINPGGGNPDTHRFDLVVECRQSGQKGFGVDVQSFVGRGCERVVVPTGRKFAVWNVKLTSPLDTAEKVAALKVSLESIQLQGVQVITTAEHLIEDRVPANAVGNVSIVIGAHLRLDEVPEEESEE